MLPVDRTNLTMKVYAELEAALFQGRLHPGQRLKIRDLAATMGVSETPIREAVMQLARVGAVRIEAGRAITVTGLTHAEYLELRTVRLELEGLATEKAATQIDADGIARLEDAHRRLVAAEAAGHGAQANEANWDFHRGLYAASAMPQLSALIDTIWLRNGPVLAFHYPHAPPTYPGRHRHLDILDALRARDPAAARAALRADLIEGGSQLVEFLRQRETQATAEPQAANQTRGQPTKPAGHAAGAAPRSRRHPR